MLGCFGGEKLEIKKKKKGFTYRKRFSMNVQVQNESLRLGQEILDLHL